VRAEVAPRPLGRARRAVARLAGAGALLAAVGALAPSAARADASAASLVEKEFANAIRRVTPATVVVVGKGAPREITGSSGVIVTKSGYVLSDGDAPMIAEGRGSSPRQFSDEVEVRVIDLKRGTYTPYPAKVIRRIGLPLDTCLVKVTTPPSGGFPYVVPGTADDLHVGSFTFAMGNSFGFSREGTPSLTAGIVSGLAPAPAGSTTGKYTEIYTSAAINPGVNGGPLVDAEGSLVGIVSTWVLPVSSRDEPRSPYPFLGKTLPIDRVKDAYRDLPDFAQIFPDPKTLPPRSKSTEMLERAFAAAARKASPSVVSLEITRSEPYRILVPRPVEQRVVMVEFPHFDGPVSGVVASSDGWIVTSLYNLANVMAVGSTDIEETIGKIEKITAHFADGQSVPAKIVARDERLGIALLKADVESVKYGATAAEPAPPEAFQVGKFVLCVGNPFGAQRNPFPLVTVGVFSRAHPVDAPDPWRGDFQTDAGVTDTSCGGAMVDVQGRVLGVATLWSPVQHGRNSGIGFGVPWDRVVGALPSLKAGKSYKYGNGFLGVTWGPSGEDEVRVQEVVPGQPAAQAGMKPGDRVVAIDGKEVKNLMDAAEGVRTHSAGERIRVTVERDDPAAPGKKTRLDIEVTLGARPKAP
jgi:S1-C subfamily serine protease